MNYYYQGRLKSCAYTIWVRRGQIDRARLPTKSC